MSRLGTRASFPLRRLRRLHERAAPETRASVGLDAPRGHRCEPLTLDSHRPASRSLEIMGKISPKRATETAKPGHADDDADDLRDDLQGYEEQVLDEVSYVMLSQADSTYGGALFERCRTEVREWHEKLEQRARLLAIAQRPHVRKMELAWWQRVRESFELRRSGDKSRETVQRVASSMGVKLTDEEVAALREIVREWDAKAFDDRIDERFAEVEKAPTPAPAASGVKLKTN
jgi:hypothetical protein